MKKLLQKVFITFGNCKSWAFGTLSLSYLCGVCCALFIDRSEIKKSLYHVFGQFGKVMDVHAKKTLKTRGQAFIVFEDIASANRAVRDMQNFNFYGKPMVQYHCSICTQMATRAGKLYGTYDLMCCLLS